MGGEQRHAAGQIGQRPLNSQGDGQGGHADKSHHGGGVDAQGAGGDDRDQHPHDDVQGGADKPDDGLFHGGPVQQIAHDLDDNFQHKVGDDKGDNGRDHIGGADGTENLGNGGSIHRHDAASFRIIVVSIKKSRTEKGSTAGMGARCCRERITTDRRTGRRASPGSRSPAGLRRMRRPCRRRGLRRSLRGRLRQHLRQRAAASCQR